MGDLALLLAMPAAMLAITVAIVASVETPVTRRHAAPHIEFVIRVPTRLLTGGDHEP